MDALWGAIVAAVIALAGYIISLIGAKNRAQTEAKNAKIDKELSEAAGKLTESRVEADNAEEEYRRARADFLNFINSGKPGPGE